ncbi:MAG: carboxylesterase family protein [Prevotellaceae bacterium]|nr:carboxylesterase family protein [Prevotellaceae bacterium]
MKKVFVACLIMATGLLAGSCTKSAQKNTTATESKELAAIDNPQVKTSDGILEGVNESGIAVFKGIPFAAPPVGDLRWKAPQPVVKWDGVRKADKFGPNPMQQDVFGDMNFGTDEMSEDCLYLNVWTPAKSADAKLPVLIYFNGGGLFCGSGSEYRYAGGTLARKGIIAITANYREGYFGFFAHPELSKEASYKGSGNYGFLDQVAAIQWVKNNIAAFGGDPEKITIVGESAGSYSVSALMASPLCKGLFAQAMGSSGSVLGFTKTATLEEAEKAGVEKAKELGCTTLAELRALPAEKLNCCTSMPGYNIDNYFFTKQPKEVYANGEQLKVPLLVGGNNAEMVIGFLLQGKPATIASVKEAVQNLFGESTDKVLELYGLQTDEDVNTDKAIALAGDVFIGYTTWKWGNMHKLTSGQPVYRYLYCHPRPEMRVKDKVAGLAGGTMDKKNDEPETPKITGAVHSADIEYAMGNLPTNRVYDWQPEDFVVSDIFSGYYVNFVKTGNPNGIGLVQWDSTNDKEIAPVLQIDVNTYQKADKAIEERYAFIDSLFK